MANYINVTPAQIPAVATVEELRNAINDAMQKLGGQINNAKITAEMDANQNRVTGVLRPGGDSDAVNLGFLKEQLAALLDRIKRGEADLRRNLGGAVSIGTISGLPVPDTTDIVYSDTDITALLRFDAGLISPGTERALAAQDYDATIAGLEIPNIFTDTQTIVKTGACLRFAGTATNDPAFVEFYPWGIGAGRKGYWGIAGIGSQSIDFANEFAVGDVALRVNSGAVMIWPFTVDNPDSAPNRDAILQFVTNDIPCWDIWAQGTPSGGFEGRYLNFSRFADDGTFLDTPLKIQRDTGNVIPGTTGVFQFGIDGASWLDVWTDNLRLYDWVGAGGARGNHIIRAQASGIGAFSFQNVEVIDTSAAVILKMNVIEGGATYRYFNFKGDLYPSTSVAWSIGNDPTITSTGTLQRWLYGFFDTEYVANGIAIGTATDPSIILNIAGEIINNGGFIQMVTGNLLVDNGYIEYTEQGLPSTSAAGKGRIAFDNSSHTFQVSEDGGAWIPLTGGTSTLVGDTLPISDVRSIVYGNLDNTKQVRFEVDGFTTTSTRVLTPPDANITLAGQNFLNQFSVNQTFHANIIAGTDNVSNIGSTATRFGVLSCYNIDQAPSGTLAIGNYARLRNVEIFDAGGSNTSWQIITQIAGASASSMSFKDNGAVTALYMNRLTLGTGDKYFQFDGDIVGTGCGIGRATDPVNKLYVVGPSVLITSSTNVAALTIPSIASQSSELIRATVGANRVFGVLPASAAFNVPTTMTGDGPGNVPLTIVGYASQTADLFNITNSASSLFLQVDASAVLITRDHKPQADILYSLGTTSRKWLKTWTADLDVTGVTDFEASSTLRVRTVLQQQGISAPSVSTSGWGSIYFDSSSLSFKVSQDGGAFVDLLVTGTGFVTIGTTQTITGLKSFSQGIVITGQGPTATVDATGLGSALDIRGSTTSNGNILLKPGAVVGAASVFAIAGRVDQPGLVVQDASGTTTASAFEIRKSDSTVYFKVLGGSNASNAGEVVSRSIIPFADVTYSLGASGTRWLKLWAANADFSSTTIFSALATFTSITANTGIAITGTGNFTMAAGTTFLVQATLNPFTNNTYDLGQSGIRYRKLWITDIDMSGNLVLGASALINTTAGGGFVGSLNPSANLTYNLGSGASGRWLKLWVGDIDVSGTATIPGLANTHLSATGSSLTLSTGLQSVPGTSVSLNKTGYWLVTLTISMSIATGDVFGFVWINNAGTTLNPLITQQGLLASGSTHAIIQDTGGHQTVNAVALKSANGGVSSVGAQVCQLDAVWLHT